MRDKFCAVTHFFLLFIFLFILLLAQPVLKNWTKGVRLSIKYLSQQRPRTLYTRDLTETDALFIGYNHPQCDVTNTKKIDE